jgi:hypothetical protein
VRDTQDISFVREHHRPVLLLYRDLEYHVRHVVSTASFLFLQALWKVFGIQVLNSIVSRVGSDDVLKMSLTSRDTRKTPRERSYQQQKDGRQSNEIGY